MITISLDGVIYSKYIKNSNHITESKCNTKHANWATAG